MRAAQTEETNTQESVVMDAEHVEDATFLAGCAQELITPPMGVSLAGYFHERVAERVRDDLFARAMVVESGGERAALVSCDLICMTEDVSAAAKEMVRAETGIPAENVLVCATHTHTGPEVRSGAVMPACEEWLDKLPRRIADSVRNAADGMFRATLRPGRTMVEGYSFNRLFRLKDGTELFGKRGRDDEIVDRAGPIDPELQTLSVVDESGRLRALAVNFAMHPDVIGGGKADFISADWPGEVAKSISAVYGEDVVTVYLQGTCGDINHVSHEPSLLPRGGEEKAVKLGRGIAGAAMLASERAEPMPAQPPWGSVEALAIPYYTRDAALLAKVEELKRRKPEELGYFDRYVIERTDAWPHDGEEARVPVHVMQIGDVAVVGFPAEIFARIGMEVKRFSPAPHTFVVELADARVSSYVPTTDQAERGAYGAMPVLSRWLCSDAGRRMADAAHAALWRRFTRRG